ncbi:MAG TPA: hypothetical protein VD886_06065 [Herpetosiphonaceae bacterium]|nr:hypothetical protein [Herpetosiphonaceae bacterium]
MNVDRGRTIKKLGCYLALLAIVAGCGGGSAPTIVGRWRDLADGSTLTFTADGVLDTGASAFCYRLGEPLFNSAAMTIESIGAPTVASTWTLGFDGPFAIITAPDNTTRRYERIIGQDIPPLSQAAGTCPPPK